METCEPAGGVICTLTLSCGRVVTVYSSCCVTRLFLVTRLHVKRKVLEIRNISPEKRLKSVKIGKQKGF